MKSGAVVDPEKIRYLKNFDSKFVVQGQLVHAIIDQQIQLHCENKPMDPVGAVSTYLRKVARYKDMATELLTEYRNGEQLNGSFFTYMEQSGKTCLDIFFGTVWPEYANRECLRHEEFDRFRIGDVEVTVKVDFTSRLSNGTIVLSDWKTGRDDNEYETELQMATYALWAMQYLQARPRYDHERTSLFEDQGDKAVSLFCRAVMRSPGGDNKGICGDERALRVWGFPGKAESQGVYELSLCGDLHRCSDTKKVKMVAWKWLRCSTMRKNWADCRVEINHYVQFSSLSASEDSYLSLFKMKTLSMISYAQEIDKIKTDNPIANK